MVLEKFSSQKWSPFFLKDSTLLKKLSGENKLLTFFPKPKQKVGFAKFGNVLSLIKNNNLIVDKLSRKIKNNDWILINPVMFIQKKNKPIAKVDPATGEFIFYHYLFHDFFNLALIYSPQTTKDRIIYAKNKLTHHLKIKSDLILLGNQLDPIFIKNKLVKDYTYDAVAKICADIDEDDIDFAIYNFFLENGYECLYISAHCASWSRIVFNGQK